MRHSVMAAAVRSPGSPRRSANGAAPPAPGRSVGARNAAGADSRSLRPALRSSTTTLPGGSCRRGRREGSVTWPGSPPRSSSSRSRGLPWRPWCSFLPIATARSSGGTDPQSRLARELGRQWGLPIEPLVCRVRSVGPQRGLGLKERRHNVSGAFAPAGVSPPRVCLVDDVYTSGATAAAAASALRKGGARNVEVVTFARAVR